MKKLLVISLLFSTSLSAQDLNISKGWKFKTGDSKEWANPHFNDSDWSPIEIGRAWESQGYKDYNGFAWYRLHIIIPSSVKEKTFLKEKLRFDLGKIDDGDEVYLNGALIGKNAGKNVRIEDGPYDAQRTYTLALNDYRIHWDKDNVIAVRVWDGNGDGGMYEGRYGIAATDVTDYVVINTNEHDFTFPAQQKVSKKLVLQSSSDLYDFTGKLRILIVDPLTGKEAFKQSIGVDFAKSRPFEYTYTATLPDNKSYVARYYFDEDRSHRELSVTEGIPYLLTPKAATAPHINGPDVYGIRPNSPFQYRIPASGQKPMTYEATGLPAGLSLNKQSGIITGKLGTKGNFKLKLVAKNKLGSSAKNFTIICGDLIGLTPALGWNSWNCWGLSVSDEKVRASAKEMSDRLADYGWTYVNIDDGWQDKHNAQGEILANDKFPDMKKLSDYIHGLGLKMGIYSSPGPKTCGNFEGSYQHELADAQIYASWGVDYLKYDWCSYGQIAPPNPTLEEFKKPYIQMDAELKKNQRDILYSLCQYGMGDVWKWGAQVGGNSWRTTGDIVDTWSNLSSIASSQDKAAPFTQPGHFNDPDMLIVGKVGWGPALHNTRLTPDEQYWHISMWCMLSSPLLIGCDMSQLDDFTSNLLTNDEVLAIDQDALAKPAKKAMDNGKFQVWTKELANGSKAIGVFNLSDSAIHPIINLSDIKLGAHVKLRDAWRQKDLGAINNSFNPSIPAHGVILLTAKTVTGSN